MLSQPPTKIPFYIESAAKRPYDTLDSPNWDVLVVKEGRRPFDKAAPLYS